MPKMIKTEMARAEPALKRESLPRMGAWPQDQFVLWRGQMGDRLEVRFITQREAAEILGVTRRTVANWEGGATPIDRCTALACEALLALASMPDTAIQSTEESEESNPLDKLKKLCSDPSEIHVNMLQLSADSSEYRRL